MKKIQKISESEMEIMQIIWHRKPPVSTSEIYEDLPHNKEWKSSTILTFLARLTEKGILSITKKGKKNLYTPLVTEQEYLEIETKSFLDAVHGGSIKSFIATLIGSNDITSDELEDLKKWFSKK